MIGIISALKPEIEQLKSLMESFESTKKAGLDFISGKIYDKDVVLLRCGSGKVNAAAGTQIMIDFFNPDAVINLGIAGSLSNKITIGDIVISTDCVEHDINRTALKEPKGQIVFSDESRIDIPADTTLCDKLADCCKNLGTHIKRGRIATGDAFIVYKGERETLAFNFNALCCEMEGGAVGHVCYMNKVPFAVLCSISDDLRFNKVRNYEEFKVLAATRAVKGLRKFIRMY